jgi:hypothetical protein
MNISPRSFLKNHLYDKIPTTKKKRCKVTAEEFKIPSYINYNVFLDINYNIPQLKSIARYYKQKVSGNKDELNTRLYNFLKYSFYAIRLQRCWKNNLRYKYHTQHGPAVNKRKLCNNVSDFLSLDDIDKIPYSQFFSYKDNDGFIYGFNIKSFYNLLKNDNEPKNPYNREAIHQDIKTQFIKLLKYGKLLKEILIVNINHDLNKLSITQQISLKANRIFQKIDSFGHITDTNWFLGLDVGKLIMLIRELVDIWDYRASLSQQTKILICPPNGNPFFGLNLSSLATQNIQTIKMNLLNIFDKMINSSPDQNNQSLGAFYILGALTLVNNQAAESMPWLYESVFHNQNN